MGTRCYDRQVIYLAAEKSGDSSLDIETLLKEDNSPKEHIFASVGFSGVQEITRLNEVKKTVSCNPRISRDGLGSFSWKVCRCCAERLFGALCILYLCECGTEEAAELI